MSVQLSECSPPVLRTYQREAVNSIYRAVKSGAKALLAVGPTGCGKALIIAKIARDTEGVQRSLLVVAHRRELLAQLRAKLADAGVTRVGVFQGKRSTDPEAAVQIASIQAIVAGALLLTAPRVIVLDEAHHYVAPQWRALLARYPEAYVLGFTATPCRSDGAPLRDIFNRMIVFAKIGELISRGFLVPVKTVAPSAYTPKAAVTPEAVFSACAEHAPRWKGIIVHAASRAHAKAVADHLTDRGIAAQAVDGTTPARVRDAALEAFSSGELRVLCNVFLFGEGLDVPSASVAVLARGFSAVGPYLQAIGRVLRPAEGKRRALVIDMRGAVHKFGLPEADRVFTLEGRNGIVGGDAPLRVCPQCEAWVSLASRICRHCGATLPRFDPVRDGKWARLLPVELAAVQREFFIRTLRYSRGRGHKDGFVAHRFVEKFGVFPGSLWREFCAARVA
jgi:superfamily II DNA or RNA helicase